MKSIEDVARERLANWKADPAKMVRELFRVEPDEWQKDALAAFASGDPAKQRIALQACAGPGKSAVEAWIGWNFQLCYSDGVNHPQGACVSITGENLKNGLWKELAHWREQSTVLKRAFEMTSESIFNRQYPKTWFLNFRSFAKSADQQAMGRTLSGLHAMSILYLVDETGDMPTAVLRSAEQGLSNCTFGKIVQAGNPTNHNGALYQAVTLQRHLWHVITITGDPNDPKRSKRIDIEWAREQIKLYGRSNPWVMAYILGQFPASAINTLLSPDEVQAAIGRHAREDQYNFAQKRLGVDCARFGDDATVIAPRQGVVAFPMHELRGARSEAIAGRVMNVKRDFASELDFIDSTGGWGAGTADALRLANVNVIEVNASEAADDPRYFNKRSEMYFRQAEWVKHGGCLPNDPELVQQGSAATYYFDKGRLRVIEKDQIKKQLNGRSPDKWEALMQTFAMVDMPAGASDLLSLVGSGAGLIWEDPSA